ncbi:glycosyltransferase family 4 protein [Zavarzinia compransoris]|uniref:Glycosyltransferase subfamily 4-like N-terminal domain-containing protein n=1 Tax=Zavarzinia compransoris TaxID=1264899 RepID=A0A317E8E5_9PROT|nr:glycosyltransferase family 1 protein [Zavarzinia compransoris]PWR21543.1 hypothetical protein DKG75_05920 [Zavarzinia compransoris]TDP45690.1 glycosyl transferase family 4 [Zavarzinia compransoris]
MTKNTHSSTSILVNARVLGVPSNGQKRVAQEIINRLSDIELARPISASGARGHLWEQVTLPLRAKGRRLWSPSTSGPICHPNHIVTVHDIAFVDGPQWFSSSFARLYDFIVARHVSRASHIVVVSNFTRGRLIEHYGARPDRVTTISSGVTKQFHRRTNEAVHEAQMRLGIPACAYLVAFLGSDPRKNTGSIIRAWQAVSNLQPEAKLVTFGQASNLRVFSNVRIRTEDPTIINVGPISDDDLACLYSGAAGFVFPSLYEGFGLPVIEATACGCRVITSNVTSLPEVSPPDALLIDPSNNGELADAMVQVLGVEDTPLARQSRIAFSARFDWDLAATRYQQVFREYFS